MRACTRRRRVLLIEHSMSDIEGRRRARDVRYACACVCTALPPVIHRRSFARGFSSGHLSSAAVPLTPVARHHSAAIYLLCLCTASSARLSHFSAAVVVRHRATDNTRQHARCTPRRRLVCARASVCVCACLSIATKTHVPRLATMRDELRTVLV